MTRYLSLALLVLLLAPVADAQAPQRIASLNLCVDQLLLALVPRERIVSVSYLTLQPENSWMADRAQGLHANHSLAEEIVPRRPDLVLAGSFTSSTTLERLRRLGLRVEILPIPESIEEIRAQLLRIGELTGTEPEARRALAAFDQRLATVRARTATPRTGLVLMPSGFTLGADTLQDDVMRAAGLRNLAAESGLTGPGRLSLETIAGLRPEVLVIDDYDTPQASLAQGMLQHPAIRHAARDATLIRVSPRLWQCGGLMVADAVETLAGGT